MLTKLEAEQVIQMTNDLTNAISALFHVRQINSNPNEQLSELETFNAQVELIEEEARLIKQWDDNIGDALPADEFGKTE
jgi:hypothetical protein